MDKIFILLLLQELCEDSTICLNPGEDHERRVIDADLLLSGLNEEIKRERNRINRE